MQKNIAIIAGDGFLPSLLLNNLKQSHSNVCIVAIKDNANLTLIERADHIVASLGQVQKVMDYLHDREVMDVVFAGGITKPSLLSMKIDKRGALFLGKVGLKKLSGGDDHLLRLVINLFEDEGFNVSSVQDIAPSLLSPKGVMGKYVPSESELKDIEVGKELLRCLGSMDVGQSVVVENEVVLGIEAAEGTDALIQRSADLKKEKKGVGVLIKLSKSSQDSRVDLPTIGIKTLELAYKSGLRGVAVGAKESLIIDKESVINFTNKHKLFIIGI